MGPDNGVLSSALPDSVRPRSHGPVAKPVRLPQGFEAVVITNKAFTRPSASATFHGRDIFAPVAAHLTLGVDIATLGENVPSMLALPVPRSSRKADGSLSGRVIHVDRFGNLITDIRASDIGAGEVTVEIAGIMLHGLAKTYGNGDNPVAMIGSSGYLEIAVPLGSAAELLEADIETPVTVRRVVVRLKRPL